MRQNLQTHISGTPLITSAASNDLDYVAEPNLVSWHEIQGSIFLIVLLSLRTGAEVRGVAYLLTMHIC